MPEEQVRRDRLRRTGYAQRARQIAAALRDDADRLDGAFAVTDVVFARIDGCLNAFVGGGHDSDLTAAVRFMYFVDEGLALERKGLAGRPRGAPSAFNGADHAARQFTSEYPERAIDLATDDWRSALEASAAIGKRGKAKPWARLAAILSKMNIDIDGENLKKACVGLRNTPGRVLGTTRWGNRSP